MPPRSPAAGAGRAPSGLNSSGLISSGRLESSQVACGPITSGAARGSGFGGPLGSVLPLLVGAALLIAAALPGQAGVRFENCVTGADGSLTCDTVPTGNTLARDVDARFGLLDQASPGWSEFDPYAGYGEDFGGNQT
jgi:hypothetical protein